MNSPPLLATKATTGARFASFRVYRIYILTSGNAGACIEVSVSVVRRIQTPGNGGGFVRLLYHFA